MDLAPLTVIGRIDDDDFWMTPDAGYRKGSSVWGKLADVKASCAVRAADEPGVKSDFATVLKNLGEMQESISRPGYQSKKVLSYWTTGVENASKFSIFYSR